MLLADGSRVAPDVVIAATGYARGLEPLVGHLGVLGPTGRPKVTGAATHPAAPRMYFTGYTNPISGMFRELNIDARRIARAIAAERAGWARPDAPDPGGAGGEDKKRYRYRSDPEAAAFGRARGPERNV